jgi:endonuclease I
LNQFPTFTFPNWKSMKLKLLFLLLLPFLCLAQIPAYYASIDFSQTGNNLKNQLTTLITNTHTTFLPYTATGTTDTWDALYQTDLNPNNSNNVLLFYGWDDTDGDYTNDYSRDKTLSCHTSSCSGLWQREHVYPRSLGTPNLGFEFAGSDAHNLRAIDSDRNGSRSNRIFEATTSSVTPFITTSGNWYPGDEWRGDVARIIMYMYVRYPSQCIATTVGAGSTSYSVDMPNVFLDWNAQDPVSQYEINRNNILNTIQGNRNPFIDNPFLATMIWNGPAASNPWNLLSNYENNITDITIYLTFTNDIVHINNPNNHNYQYVVYNTIGQEVIANTTTDVIDISNNSKGLYFIKLQFENQSKIFKVILN